MHMKPFNKEKKDARPVGIGDIVLHGDVLLERIEELPGRFNTLETSKDGAIAYGELSGHVHQLTGEFDLRIDNENPNNRYLRIVEPTTLRHQEHAEVLLPPGYYRTRIQREYDPFTKRIREVAD